MILLKSAIVIVFVALLVCLTGAYTFLMRDKDQETPRRRTWYSLTVRLLLTVLLMILLIYGVYSGQLVSQAPWGLS